MHTEREVRGWKLGSNLLKVETSKSVLVIWNPCDLFKQNTNDFKSWPLGWQKKPDICHLGYLDSDLQALTTWQ